MLRTAAFTACALLLTVQLGSAQESAFTYQGRLDASGAPANGSYDLQFTLYGFNPVIGYYVVAGPVTNAATTVSNGLFATTLDFGEQFTGAARWLEIAVRTNGGGALFTLSPRQPLTPAPYAITAGNVVSGGLAAGTYGNAVNFNNPSNQFSGSFGGNGANLTNVNALTLNGLGSGAFWQLGGNNVAAGQFLGGLNNQPVEIWANNSRALRLEPNTNGAPNVIGGSTSNFVAAGVIGATIGGGGATNYGGNAWINNVIGDMGTIGGGGHNTAGAYATIGGGTENSAGPVGSYSDTVGGGFFNFASGNYTTVSGGLGNFSAADAATVGGGNENTIVSTANYSFIGGGQFNLIQGDSYASTIAGGQFNTVQSNSAGSFIGSGNGNALQSGSYYGVIGGGESNLIQNLAINSTIAGGYGNTVVAEYGSIAGGLFNTTTGPYATVPGGYLNVAGGAYSMAAGRNANASQDRSFVWNSFPSTAFSYLSDRFHVLGTNGFSVDYFTQRPDGGGTRWVEIGPQFPGETISTWTGAYLSDSGTWQNASDRNRKTDFESIDPRGVLEKIAALPVQSWRYTNEVTGIKHIGPTAQDFKASFGLGMDDKTISSVDEAGVALAAIQALNQKLEEESKAKDAKIAQLERSVADLKELMNRLGHSKGGN